MKCEIPLTVHRRTPLSASRNSLNIAVRSCEMDREREKNAVMVTNFHLQALMRAMNNTFLKGYDILFITCCTLRLKRHLPVKKYNNTHLLKHAAVQFVKVDFTFFVRTSQNLEKPNDRCVNYPC